VRQSSRWAVCLVGLAAGFPVVVGGQTVAAPPASAARTDVAPGVTHARFVDPRGPWVINTVKIDLRGGRYAVRHVRAKDSLVAREKMTSMVARQPEGADAVVAAINADFFVVRTGENENNQVIGGEWWKGLRGPDSQFDAFGIVRTQFGMTAAGKPLLDRYSFDGSVFHRAGAFPLHTVNFKPRSGSELVALFTERMGTTPRDTTRATAEAPLRRVGSRGDTGVYLRIGAVTKTGGNAIAAGTAVLAAYGPRSNAVAQFAEGDTIRLLLRAVGLNSRTPVTPSVLIGGWPGIIRDGKSIAARAPWDEATISSNAEARHPRSAIGFNRDSTQLILMTVDGRQAASVGVTLVELADLMLKEGAWDALNFDGGGSTTMAVRGAIVNKPSDAVGEREIGNALLVVQNAPRPAPPPAARASAQRAALPQLDSAQLVRDLFVLAADSMEGRRIGTPGNAKARAYLVRRLNALGIAPLKDSLQAHFTSIGRGGDTTRGVNLVGVVRGTKTPERYIVLTAHYDHVGVREGAIYPGADDNASGTATVLAIAAWLKKNPPANSVIIALFDGEESGLRGARAFVGAPPVPLGQIIANVNLDMVGRNEKGELYAAGATPNPQFRPLLEATIAVAPVKLILGHDSGTGSDNWTSQSDQGAFHAQKVPWVYFGVEDHPDYHKPTDFPIRIEPGFFHRCAQTIAEFVKRLDASPPARP
jgi:hypothetical protein